MTSAALRICKTLPVKVLSGYASTVKRTVWPIFSLPTSASSILPWTSMEFEIIGDGEQRRRLKRDRYGLTRIDVPANDHPIDGRTQHCAL